MISVTILVKNGARKLKEVLDALSSFKEVILYDTGSEDATLEIARAFSNVVIYQKPFIGFGPCRNEAAHVAKQDWILAIDADEILSPGVIAELKTLDLKGECVYSIPFLNYYNQKLIKWCGWYPEKHIRLYNKKKTRFSEALIHEGVVKQGMCEITLKNPIHHYPYDSISDFLVKMERYSSLFAQQYYRKKRSSLFIALLHGWGAFFKSFCLKKGFLGGVEGFTISAYNGHTAFYKYLKLYHKNKT
jgi:glycosyltransferase involved in cell wall biosynthesis